MKHETKTTEGAGCLGYAVMLIILAVLCATSEKLGIAGIAFFLIYVGIQANKETGH